MNLVTCDGLKDFSEASSNWCQTHVSKLGARSLFVPAGQTPRSLYALWERERPTYLGGLELLQIDDVLMGPGRGMFRAFFERELPSYQSQLRFVDRCEKVGDLAVLGLGLNGHVAFHEPGLRSDFFSGCIRLSDITCDHLGMERGTWGITYGAGAFLRSKAILMMVQGASKREVLERLLDGDPNLPATALKDHPHFTVIADREASGR